MVEELEEVVREQPGLASTYTLGRSVQVSWQLGEGRDNEGWL